MSWEKCWLCLRASPQKVLGASHKLFPDDPDLAWKIGMRAAGLLKEAYLKNPTALCGKSTRGLIGAALYVACILEKEWKTQHDISYIMDITQHTIRLNYRQLIKILELEDTLLQKVEPWERKRGPYYVLKGYHSGSRK